MWFVFFEALAVALIALYLPGYLFWRAFKFEPIMSLCVAPIASIAGIGVAAVAFEKAGLPAHAATIGITVLGVYMIIQSLSSFRRQKRATLAFPATFTDVKPARKGKRARSTTRFDWLLLAAYVVFGMVVTWFVFIRNIGDPSAFFSRWDNQTHISLVRAFLDSGTWSSLVTSQYLAAAPEAQPYLSGAGFYPAGWHDVVAFACSATGASVPIGINAVNTAFAGVVLPASMFAFIKAAFSGDRFTLAAGAVTASACAIFPWWFFVTGPLYPNFAGLALVPASAGCAIAILRRGLFVRKLPSVIVLAVLSVATLALLQPNAVFFLLIVLVAYGASHIYRFAKEHKGVGVAIGATVAFAIVIAAVWLACLHAPFLQSVVQYRQSAKPGIPAAIFNLVGMVGVEPLFALAALFGLIVCCKRRMFWIVVPAAFMGLAYMFSRLDPTGIGRMLGGFWYTDFRRLGACFGFTLVPLAACGLGALLKLAYRPKKREGASSGKLAIALCGVIAVAFFALNAFPSVEVELGGEEYGTGFGTFTSQIYKTYNPKVEHAYATEEVKFVDKVKRTIDGDYLVINQPNDGSTFAYGVNGLNTYYRHCRTGDQTEDSIAIRTGLANYASDAAVQQAVADIGATYVLQLDQGVALEDGVWLPQYHDPAPWSGIDAIADDTPGFRLVLSDGDMRLYEIEGAA